MDDSDRRCCFAKSICDIEMAWRATAKDQESQPAHFVEFPWVFPRHMIASAKNFAAQAG